MKKFIYPILLFSIAYFLIGSIYDEMTKDKTPGKAKRLECQKRVTTFEKAFDNTEIVLAQKQVESEKIEFTSTIEKTKYTASILEKQISLEKLDEIFGKALQGYFQKTNSVDTRYTYSYYIYENDKNDPGKKNKKSKLYAGYVVFEVKNKNNKTIYKVQIDFMNEFANDIEQSLNCSVKSFMTYNK